MFCCVDQISRYIKLVPTVRLLNFSLLILHTFHHHVMTFPYRSNNQLNKISEVLESNLYSKQLEINFTYERTTTKSINPSPKYKAVRRSKVKQRDYYITPKSSPIKTGK